MKKITKICVQEKNKNRCNVYLDDEFAFGLEIKTAYKYGLKVGLEVDENKIASMTSEDEISIAFEKCVKYLSEYSKTEKQLYTYLKNKEYSSKIIFEVINKLKENAFLDDERFCKRYIEQKSNIYGRKMLELKLLQKGVKKEVIAKVFLDDETDFSLTATNVLEKYLRNKEINKKNLEKAFRYLISKGFSYEEVKNALSNYEV
ncbi:MAG: RecX family transcriptional regulator [Clostridia bacterium]|nr:RecX family transcriptional regulator [Clostridia bacterium]